MGLLALATLAAAIIMSFKITSQQASPGGYVQYQAILNDAMGIFEKSPLKVAGINAGRIKRIQLYDNRALVSFEVLKEIKVTKGSKLQIKTLGFLGDKYIDILLNKEVKMRLPEGSIIPSVEVGNIGSIAKDAAVILKDVREIVGQIKESITSKVAGDEPPLESIISNIKETVENINYEFDVNNPDSLLAHAHKLTPAFENINASSEDIRSIVSKIRRGQGTLGKLINDEEVINQVTETLSGVKTLVSKIDSIRSELSVFTAAHTQEDNVTDLNIDIYPSPERFYRLGVVTSELGLAEGKQVVTSVNGGPETVTETTQRERGSYRFNAMIGRKIQNYTFRFGLIESMGGVGVDYDFATTRLSLDVFDYRDHIGPQLELGLRIQLWNIFYGKITGEDLSGGEDQRGLSVGVGLHFTEEDMKGLIGFLL